MNDSSTEESPIFPARTQQRTQTLIIEAVLTVFERTLTGNIIRPDDAKYGEALPACNSNIDNHPALIVQCETIEDVQRTLDFARKNNLLLTVCDGRHIVAGAEACDKGLVIDLSLMSNR